MSNVSNTNTNNLTFPNSLSLFRCRYPVPPVLTHDVMLRGSGNDKTEVDDTRLNGLGSTPSRAVDSFSRRGGLPLSLHSLDTISKRVRLSVHSVFDRGDEGIVDGRFMPFKSHRGPGRFDNTLAMSLPYPPILSLRNFVSKRVGFELNYFKGWDPEGESHVTVLTPLELFDVLLEHLSMDEIEKIANDHQLQDSILKILGIGHGGALDNPDGETFFVVVESKDLLAIRQAVYQAYCLKGGDPKAFDPGVYYPHITIGFTQRDLHIGDGVIKDMEHSRDPRFKVSPHQMLILRSSS